jgi:glycine/D-amino acid oxidase-like deaminating enzyme
MADSSVSGARFEGELPQDAEVVVIGGGIAGASTAYHLASAGVRTVLLERDRIASGATATAVGLLAPPMRQPFNETVRFRGQAAARAIWEFALRSVDGLAALLTARGEVEASALDLSGGYVLAEAHTVHEVQASHRALEEAGLPVEWLTAEDVRKLGHGRGFLGGYRLEGGGSVNPCAATTVLANAAVEAGATVIEDLDVDSTRREGGFIHCGTDRGEVKTEMVVYATHVDSRRFSTFAGDEIVPIRGQGMVVSKGVPTFKGAFSTHWKLNVWRSDGEGGLVLGGWRHDAWDRAYWKVRPEIDEHLQADIEAWFNNAFPDTAPLQVDRRWSGIFGWTADYLPLVGPLPGRVGELVVSGFSGGGLPFAFESGRVIRSIVMGTDPVAGSELFNPRRFAS